LLDIKGHAVRLEVFSLLASPGETVRIGLLPYAGVELELSLDGKPAGRRTELEWELAAPRQPGLYHLQLRRPDTGEMSQLKLWVTVPRASITDGKLQNYRIGDYPPPRSNRSNYNPPAGFIEVTADNIDTVLSPHFTLRQFICKQESGFPKYVVVQESLLLLVEGLVANAQDKGFAVKTLGIISGYRTPWYNQRIGNVKYSRHVYGDAMDIFVDADGDGRMDDLNGDGNRNAADIQLFYDMVNDFKARPENLKLVGGVGRYNKTSRHGGFVHVDTRGYRARW
jgi:hypothetical protein